MPVLSGERASSRADFVSDEPLSEQEDDGEEPQPHSHTVRDPSTTSTPILARAGPPLVPRSPAYSSSSYAYEDGTLAGGGAATAVTTALGPAVGSSSSVSISVSMGSSGDEEPGSLRATFLKGYLLMTAAHWLQGLHWQSLFASYGVQQADVVRLAVVGFASSALLGSVVSAMADVWGAQRLSLVYAALTIVSSLAHRFGSSSNSALLFGRVLSGVATSILLTSPELWLLRNVNGHGDGRSKAKSRAKGEGKGGDSRGDYSVLIAHADGSSSSSSSSSFFSSPSSSSSVALLPRLLAAASQGNSLGALAAAVLGDAAAQIGGPVAPFDLAIACSALGAIFIASHWPDDRRAIRRRQKDVDADEEEHHDGCARVRLLSPLRSSLRCWASVCATACTSRRLLCVALIQTALECAVYEVVLLWRATLTAAAALSHTHEADAESRAWMPVPHVVYPGLVFASLMLSAWCGSRLFDFAVAVCGVRLERFGLLCLAVAACALGCVPLLEELYPRLVAFTVFELAVGGLWPCMAAMRAHYIEDESSRATCMGALHLPPSLVMAVALLQWDVEGGSGSQSAWWLSSCAAALALAALASRALALAAQAQGAAKGRGSG